MPKIVIATIIFIASYMLLLKCSNILIYNISINTKMHHSTSSKIDI